MDLHDFWYATLQVNANHIGKFATLCDMYVHYMVTWCWRQWNHIVHVVLSHPQKCGHSVLRIWIRWSTASDVSFKRGSTIRGYSRYRIWPNFGEISSNIYKDIAFAMFSGWVIACCNFDLWPLTPIANQHYEPKCIGDQNLVKFPSRVIACCDLDLWPFNPEI